MITNCGGIGYWELGSLDPTFLQDIYSMVKVAIPAGICLAVWKLRLTNRRLYRPTVSILGLSDAIEDRDLAASWSSQISPLKLFICGTTLLVTFDLGCLLALLR